MSYSTLVHEWFEEVWNQRNAQAIDRLLAPDAVVHGTTGADGTEPRGPEAFKQFQARFLAAFPDIKFEVVDTVAQGNKLAARCIVRGTHQGDALGVPPTHRKTEFTGLCLARIEAGQIVEAWNNFDLLTMHTQLGTLDALSQGRIR